jgi:hypothetical protein
MINGRFVIAVAGSISTSVFIVGAGAPGGVRDPCANAEMAVPYTRQVFSIFFIIMV